jgi:hypothetical protein
MLTRCPSSCSIVTNERVTPRGGAGIKYANDSFSIKISFNASDLGQRGIFSLEEDAANHLG